MLPNAHILAGNTRQFDAFWLLHKQPTELRFNVFCDGSYFVPQMNANKYQLTYLVVSDNFPAASASFIFTLDEALERISSRLNRA
jgi:hypothetical protein